MSPPEMRRRAELLEPALSAAFKEVVLCFDFFALNAVFILDMNVFLDPVVVFMSMSAGCAFAGVFMGVFAKKALRFEGVFAAISWNKVRVKL
jgi:hypothetical protein